MKCVEGWAKVCAQCRKESENYRLAAKQRAQSILEKRTGQAAGRREGCRLFVVRAAFCLSAIVEGCESHLYRCKFLHAYIIACM